MTFLYTMLNRKICPDKTFIAKSTHKSSVKVISEIRFKRSAKFYLSSLWNYSFLFHSVALMSRKQGLSARRRNSERIFWMLLWCKFIDQVRLTLLFIVLQFKTISSFTIRKEPPRNRKMTIFNRFLSKHTTLLKFLQKTNSHGGGNENYAMHFSASLRKIYSSNEATSDRFIDRLTELFF